MPEKVVRKTTAKKTVRRTVTKTVPARSTVSKTVASSGRKAPVRITPAPITASPRKKTPKPVFIGIALFIVLLGVSVAIGYSDTGELNVENMISLRKQNATGAEHEALLSVPTEQTDSAVPNGGLVGMGQSDPVVVPAVVATSTDSTATSTATSSEASVTIEETTQAETSETQVPVAQQQ